MTGRSGYLAALVVAVVALVGSVIAVVAVMSTSSPWAMNPAAGTSSTDGWRAGLAGGAMMGDGVAADVRPRGMMGNWNDSGTAAVTLAQAKAAADLWVAANQPGASTGLGAQMPMGYVFSVSKEGKAVGMAIVSDDTGAVTWVQFAQPTPAASAS